MFGIKFKKQIAQSDNSTYPRNACPPPIPERKSGSHSSQNPIKEAKKRNAKRKAQRKARKINRITRKKT